MRANEWVLVVSAALLAWACDGGGEAAKGEKAAAPGQAAGPGAATPPVAAPASVASPEALGFCEYTVEGGEPNRGGGGRNNVASMHWMTADQPGRSVVGQLLLNCGKAPQVSLSPHNLEDPVPMAPGKYTIDKTGAKGTFSLIGGGALAEPGEIDITAWDASHVAGTFRFKAEREGGVKQITGRFDLRCPYGTTAACRP